MRKCSKNYPKVEAELAVEIGVKSVFILRERELLSDSEFFGFIIPFFIVNKNKNVIFEN